MTGQNTDGDLGDPKEPLATHTPRSRLPVVHQFLQRLAKRFSMSVTSMASFSSPYKPFKTLV